MLPLVELPSRLFADKARAKGVGARGALEPLLVAKLWLAARLGGGTIPDADAWRFGAGALPRVLSERTEKAENEESDRSKLANNLEPRIPSSAATSAFSAAALAALGCG